MAQMAHRRLHWRRDRMHNFGDAYNIELFQHLGGRVPEYAELNSNVPYYTMIGSYLHVVGDNAQVWGTGFTRATDRVNPRARYHAVRGPLSGAKIRAAGGDCPEIYGDPLTLMPGVPRTAIRPLGVIPQWREQHLSVWQGLHTIDITAADVIARIAECEVIVSSSLHGLIAAHTLGIPAIWVRPSDAPLGDGFKFRDYYASVDVDILTLEPKSPRQVRMAADLAFVPESDRTAFRNACPFRHETPESGRDGLVECHPGGVTDEHESGR